MTLRPYQRDAVAACIDHAGDRPILVSPTGSGKTRMASDRIRSFLGFRDGPRVLVIAPRREIIRQTASALEGQGIQSGVIAGDDTRDTDRRVLVASPDTLARRELPDGIGLVVVDECHFAPRKSVRILDAYPDALRLGLTATPYRLDGTGLGSFGWRRLIVASGVQQLVDDGHLILPRWYSHPPPDLSSVGRTRSDFVASELGVKLSESKIVGDLVDTWRRRTPGTMTVGFAVSVAHAHACAAEFRAADIPAEALDASMPQEHRDGVLERLKDGTTLVVWNVEILGMGWDLPALQTAILARPTLSLALYLQQVGRVMRPPGPATVLDCAGNYHRHGLPTEAIDLTLDGKPCRPTVLGTRTCLECYAITGAGVPVCPDCGHRFGCDRPRSDVRHEPGELAEVIARIPYADRRDAWYRLSGDINERKAAFRNIFGSDPVLVGPGWIVDDRSRIGAYRREVHRSLCEWYRETTVEQGMAARACRAVFGTWPKSVAGYRWVTGRRRARSG